MSDGRSGLEEQLYQITKNACLLVLVLLVCQLLKQLWECALTFYKDSFHLYPVCDSSITLAMAFVDV